MSSRVRVFGRALFALAIAALASSATAAAQTPAPEFRAGDERAEDFPDGPGREETFNACTGCHNFKLVAAQGMTRPQWDGTLTWMTQRHNMPDIQGEERELILRYLEAHYGPRTPARGGSWKNPFAPD